MEHAENVMGIYDREYYRRDGPSFLGSFVESGRACKWLIGINIVCFLLQMLTRSRVPGVPGWDEPFTSALCLDARKVLDHFEVWRLLTYAFLHSTGDILHIVFNMLFLWWFGQQVEEDMGSREFVVFYLLSALVGGVVFTAGYSVGLHGGLAVGASAAVMAVTVLFALHHPRTVIYLFFVLPVPVWLFVVFIVAKDVFAFLGRAQNGVAWSAHLGGAAFGFAYEQFHLRLTGWWGSVQLWRWRRRTRPSLRLYREEEPPTPVSATVPSDLEALKAEVDLILEKISLVGKDNLTEHERQVLLRASEVLKRRRG
jgi:membrane associated rhomboid family serine protease